jgi:hypothetical protein
MSELTVKVVAAGGYVAVVAILGYHAWLAVLTVREYRQKMQVVTGARPKRESPAAVSFGLTGQSQLK